MATRALLCCLLLAIVPAPGVLWAKEKAPAPSFTVGEHVTGRVVGVHDGDSLTFYTGSGPQLKIRLEGIDAPELTQAFGAAAKKLLSDLAYAREVVIEVTGRDRYGRTLGVVRVGGRNVNLEMVRSGYAWHFVTYSKSPALAAAEKAAREARAGLWADEAPVAPWDYRATRRAKQKLE